MSQNIHNMSFRLMFFWGAVVSVWGVKRVVGQPTTKLKT
jgi:hypothetical protein